MAGLVVAVCVGYLAAFVLAAWSQPNAKTAARRAEARATVAIVATIFVTWLVSGASYWLQLLGPLGMYPTLHEGFRFGAFVVAIPPAYGCFLRTIEGKASRDWLGLLFTGVRTSIGGRNQSP